MGLGLTPDASAIIDLDLESQWLENDQSADEFTMPSSCSGSMRL